MGARSAENFLNKPLLFHDFPYPILCVDIIQSPPRSILCVDKIQSPPNHILCVPKTQSPPTGTLCVDKIRSRPSRCYRMRARARQSNSAKILCAPRISADRDSPDIAQPATKNEGACTGSCLHSQKES